MNLERFFKSFLEQEKLPESYEAIAKTYFIPLANRLVARYQSENRPIVVGVNGSQGSGKSTLTEFLIAYLNQVLDCQSIGMSIDDFYLTKSQRQSLSESQHPLLVTRGVPGTHDLELLNKTVDDLLYKKPPFTIPKFLKAIDDRAPSDDWSEVIHDVKIIILEGWCVGCPSQDATQLAHPINELEELEDADGSWRSFINSELKKYEQSIFNKIDYFVMLKAPGFHIVKQWRQEQETKLEAKLTEKAASTGVMTPQEIERFIAHYQRITEHGFIEIPKIADDVFELNEQRQIVSVSIRAE